MEIKGSPEELLEFIKKVASAGTETTKSPNQKTDTELIKKEIEQLKLQTVSKHDLHTKLLFLQKNNPQITIPL